MKTYKVIEKIGQSYDLHFFEDEIHARAWIAVKAPTRAKNFTPAGKGTGGRFRKTVDHIYDYDEAVQAKRYEMEDAEETAKQKKATRAADAELVYEDAPF